MKTTLRQAFEDIQLPKNPTEGQMKMARQLLNRMDKADAAVQQRKQRVRKAPAMPEVRGV
jgi:hypothetical protein